MLRLEHRDDGVTVLWLDDPREPVNTLRAELAEEFQRVLDTLQESSAAKALVIISAKPDNFIAGANLEMLQSVKSIAEGRELAELLNKKTPAEATFIPWVGDFAAPEGTVCPRELHGPSGDPH